MGGGGAMRAAAKVAGVVGFRGTASGVPPVEQSIRKVSVPVSSSISSSSASQSVKAAAGSDVASVQKHAWEIDDWEFAGAEDELFIPEPEPMPRVVFGGVPTFQEAKEATTELKDALNQVYLGSYGSAGDVTADQVAGMSLISNKSDSETKSCVTVMSKPNDSVPPHALQAFRLLSSSPAAQNVVASIACDQNVWNAVMQNSDLQQFIVDSKTVQSVDELQNPPASKKFEEDETTDSSSQSNEAGKGFMDILQNIRFQVTAMVSNVKSFLSNIFGPPSDVNGDGKTTGFDTTAAASLMGLAVLVITVVLLKRG